MKKGTFFESDILKSLQNLCFVAGEEIVGVENSFRSTGNALPPIFISTPYDQNESIWTKKAPSQLVLNRIGSLAERALTLVDEQLDTASNLSFHALFRAPISEYDCIIRLHSSLNPRRYQFHDLSDKYPVTDLNNVEEKSIKKIPVIGFDPVQRYLQELRVSYYYLHSRLTKNFLVRGKMQKSTTVATKKN